MRAYVPVTWEDLDELSGSGTLPGPRAAYVVDPAWCAADPGATEEEWEYEAQELAADALDQHGGVVLALEVAVPGHVDDGLVELPGPIQRRAVAAVFTADLAWFGLQEVPHLLAQRAAPSP